MKNIGLINLPIKEVYLETTSKCNFKCEFCPSLNMTRTQQHMDFDLFKRLADEIADLGMAECMLFHNMGEPLLYPHIKEAVHYICHEKKLFARVITNGSLITPDIVKSFSDSGLNELAISLQTPDNKTFDEYRKTGIGFEKYMSTILQALKYVHELDSKMLTSVFVLDTTSKKYFKMDTDFKILDDKASFQSILLDLVKKISEAIDVPFSESHTKEVISRMKLRDWSYLKITDKIMIETKPISDWGNALYSGEIHPAKIGYCSLALDHTMAILSSGDLVLCCADYDANTKIGNVYDNTIKEILESDAAQNVLKGFKKYKIVHPYCRKCIGGNGRIYSFVRGLLSIYLFKVWNKKRRGKEYPLY